MDGFTEGKASVQNIDFTSAYLIAYVCATEHFYLLDEFRKLSQYRKETEETRRLYNKLVGEERGYI